MGWNVPEFRIYCPRRWEAGVGGYSFVYEVSIIGVVVYLLPLLAGSRSSLTLGRFAYQNRGTQLSAFECMECVDDRALGLDHRIFLSRVRC